MNNLYIEYTKKIEKRLSELLKDADIGETIVSDAMKYSISAGGKRIRPLLTLEFCNLCCEDYIRAIDYACAVEMIHTYSLIHDDLPCMDDDDMRRGRPSCHIAFGEEYALLAGDALLTKAFEIVSDADLNFEKNCKAVKVLADCAGYLGMIGGQTLDLKNENKSVTIDSILRTDLLKTGKLIEAACVLGCVAAGADNEKIKSAISYSHSMGIAFQIIDDILDETSTVEQLGKPIGSDRESNKSTYVSILGLEKAMIEAEKYTSVAINSLDIFGEKSQLLKDFTLALLSRDK